MVHSLHKKTCGGNIMMKINMVKACDRVDWAFLLRVFECFDFSANFCRLVGECIQSPWFSVMMHGTYKGFFKSSHGLRQGDHSSPYLFILMEEVLTRLLRKNFDEGCIKSFYHPTGAPLISHLLYVDDLLVFVNGNKSSVKRLMDTLGTYEHWSGQVMSKEKSAFFPSKLINASRVRSLV